MDILIDTTVKASILATGSGRDSLIFTEKCPQNHFSSVIFWQYEFLAIHRARVALSHNKDQTAYFSKLYKSEMCDDIIRTIKLNVNDFLLRKK